MPSCKLILTDIDGTILPYGQKTVSDFALSAIHKAQAAGITFGACSGRATEWIPPLFKDDAAAVDTCIAVNGLEVVLHGKTLRRATIDPQLLDGLVAYVKGRPQAGVLCFEGATPYLVCGSRDDLMECFPRYGRTCVEVDRVPRDAEITKANVFIVGDLAATADYVAELNAHVEGLDFDVPQPAFSNVMPAGINKATGIDVLADALGIGLDEVVAFGDGGNDVPMLEHVKNSVAVAGAHEDAKAAARWHIGPCEEDSVAHAIDALAEGAWPFEK